ncbi:MAG: exo-alpha-sialidase, partial [Verrucomicrobiae bacterium]|nr:exo-alpha-sialidase [Verrucomicrobiae bacterium]
MNPRHGFLGLFLILSLARPVGAAEEVGGVEWLVTFDGRSLPAAPWVAVGKPNASTEADGLRLSDDSPEFGHFQAPWTFQPGQEIVVEVEVKVSATTGSQKNKSSASLWPWRDGAPVSVLVSDGRHQEGLVLFASQATSFTDRFVPMDTTNRFHAYRLIIRGDDMEMWVDGERRVTGQGAFWKPADSAEPFVRFGSNAKTATGEAVWRSVRLGVRPAKKASPPDPIRVTVGESWEIPRDGVRQTRPYLYDLGEGLLLMSVAQGPDAFYEPYGLLKSTDAGKTWAPIPGLDQVDTTPLPVLRRPDGSILAMSRWTRTRADGAVVGKTTLLDREANAFTQTDNRIELPQEYANESEGDQIICERHLWNDPDGGVTMVVWSRKRVPLPDGRASTARFSHLVRSTDEGKTWRHVSTIGPGGEPAVVRLSETEQTAVIRGDRNSRMKQVFSHDGGKTWSEPVELEVGKVLPDLVLMSNGVLACSYGRPASCLMFSLDGGRNWISHH